MSDNDSGYRSAYQYRPNTDPPSHPGDRQQWSEARDGERLRSSMKAHGELMNSLQNGSGGDGSGKWIVVAAFLLFTVCACFVAIAKEMTRLSRAYAGCDRWALVGLRRERHTCGWKRAGGSRTTVASTRSTIASPEALGSVFGHVDLRSRHLADGSSADRYRHDGSHNPRQRPDR